LVALVLISVRIAKLIIQSQRLTNWNEVKVLLQSKGFLKEVPTKMGAEILKFDGTFEKDNYLKDFSCPHCQQQITEQDISEKNYRL
jgi:hypothetical protein